MAAGAAAHLGNHNEVLHMHRESTSRRSAWCKVVLLPDRGTCATWLQAQCCTHLVDHDEVLILVHNVQRDVLRNGLAAAHNTAQHGMQQSAAGAVCCTLP